MQPDIAALFNAKFDRNEQLELVASTLEHLRANYPNKWKSLGEGKRAPEFKAIVSSLIRAADESVDHQATVSYVTRAVLDELETLASSRQPRRVYKRDITKGRRFSHEHATPVEVVLRTVTLPANQNAPILQILQNLCCRVLVTADESKKIDSKHAWTVPAVLSWKHGVSFGVGTLNPLLMPIIRYHEVDPNLAFSMVALGPVHEETLNLFRRLMGATTPKEMLQGIMACRRDSKISFKLSDDIFQGTARLPFYT